MGREGKQGQALKHWKMRNPTAGVLGDDSPSGIIQTFHKTQDCGYIRSFVLKEIITFTVCFGSTVGSEIRKWQKSKVEDRVQVVQCHSSLCQEKYWCSIVLNSCSMNLLLKN